jgi:hypothetical protein
MLMFAKIVKIVTPVFVFCAQLDCSSHTSASVVRLQIQICAKKAELGQDNNLNGQRALPLKIKLLELAFYLLPLASETTFTELYAKPVRVPNSHRFAL